MANVDLGDVTIHYEEVGEGPLAFVLCESDHMTWEPTHHDTRYPSGEQTLLDEIGHWKADFGRAIWWEYRGKGESSEAAKYSFPLMASDLARLLDKLEVERAVVYGLEWGGFLVQQFGLDYPEKSAALVIDSTSSEVDLAASENWYKQSSDRLKDSVSFPERPEYSVFVCRAAASLREQPFTPRLKQITSPTLIVIGARDTANTGGSVIMSRNIPNSMLKIYEDGGHGQLRERPSEVQELVVQLCRERGVI